MAKFEQQARLGGIQNPRLAEAQTRSTLADSLQSFSQYSIDKYRQGRLQATQEEALQADYSSPEMRSEANETGRLYNEIVQAGHLASIKNDYTKRIGELALEHEADPTALEAKLKAYKSETLNNAHPSVRQQISLDFDQATTRPLLKSTQAFKQKTETESINEILKSVNTYVDDAAKAARDGDLNLVNYNREAIETAAQQLEEMGQYQQAQALRDGLDERIDKQIVMGQANAAIQSGNGKEYIKNFIENPPEDLTPEQVDSYASTMVAMNSRYASVSQQEQLKLTTGQKRQISNLKILANTGRGDPEEIMGQAEDFFSRGWISEEERTSIFSKLLKVDEQAVKEAQDMFAVSQRLSGDDTIVVDDKAVDKYYQEVLMPEMQDDPATALEKQVNFIDRMKSVPLTLKRQLQTFVASNDVDLIRQASSLVDRVDQIPGLVDSVFKPHQQAFMDQVLLLSENLDPREAVELARSNTNPDDKARIEARTNQIKEMKKGMMAIDYKERATDAFTSFFGGPDVDDIVADSMGREYGALFEAYYKAGNSEDQAHDNAAKRMRRNWSEFNGRVMKYPPNLYYSVAGDSDYIMDQLHNDVNKLFYFDEPVKKSQIVLISNEQTARGASKGRPGYRIGIIEGGGLRILPPPAGKGLWAPDVEKQRKKIERKHEAMFNKTESELNAVSP